jgi:enamine deaminase RidA (YjgF/YER057c/UK114 family)
MSQVVVHGNTLYMAGQVATESRGQSVTEQTREILARIEQYLIENGSDKISILSANVWLSDISTFNEFNEVWDNWVVEGHMPCRACVESKLVFPDMNVEVAVIAALKE